MYELTLKDIVRSSQEICCGGEHLKQSYPLKEELELSILKEKPKESKSMQVDCPRKHFLNSNYLLCVGRYQPLGALNLE